MGKSDEVGSGTEPIQGAELRPIQEDAAIRSPQYVLSGRQRTLLNALERMDATLARMYQGGFVVLSDVSNPDRYSLCAHGMRELMEKLPKFLEVPTKAQDESLLSKVRELEGAFERMYRQKASSKGVDWHGRLVDRYLHEFLQRIEHFFEWLKTYHPRRRIEVLTIVEKLDASGRQLPPRFAQLNVDSWEDIHDYFQSIAHHGKAAVHSDFASRLGSLEQFLLDRFAPQTFEDFDEIDKLLEQGR